MTSEGLWGHFRGILSFMEHKTISSDKGTVHYWEDGNYYETIVFTHGATMDHGMFQKQIEYFVKNYKVISWDVPLHGLSRPYQDFTLQNAADGLVQILDAEDIGKAHLVGQSMGGYISQIVAYRYSDRVCSLVCVDSSPIGLSYYSKLDKWLLSITPSLLKLYPHNYLIKTITKGIALEQSAQSYALEVLQTYTISEIAVIMQAVYQGLLADIEDQPLSCPVLIVYGEKDTTGKVKEYSDRWARQENWEITVIPEAAHNSNMDNPSEFNKALEKFLEKN
jgi:pimeloyl-ACP methyl ester carboxylesterase